MYFGEWPQWLPDSHTVDINNISPKPFAGSVVSTLFLQRFVAADLPWLHFDLYTWNEQVRSR
jgi:leucyl aminopeptidase